MRGSDRQLREAFEAEMLPHLDAAYRLARALTRHEQDAEDLVQDAYLRAYDGFARYQRGTNARAWLLTILRRIYLNNQRRARSRPLVLPRFAQDERQDQAPSSEGQVLKEVESRRVLDALATLPEPMRSALALVDLEGMRYAEAAAILGCPTGTVMSRLHRGRLELARRLQDAQVEWRTG